MKTKEAEKKNKNNKVSQILGEQEMNKNPKGNRENT